MRILNRPMFKYGGPIKEGVMHGMRSNYAGGQRVGAFNVGSPVKGMFPKDVTGREHHVAPAIGAGIWYGAQGLARLAPTLYRAITGAKNISKASNLAKNVSSTGRSLIKVPGGGAGGPGASYNLGTMGGTGRELMVIPQVSRSGKVINKIKDWFKADPLYSSVAGGTTALGRGIKWTGKKGLEFGKYATTTPSGLLFFGAPVTYAAGKYFLSDGKEIKGDDLNKITQGPQEKWSPGVGGEQYDPSTSPSAMAAAAKKARTAKLEKYLDTMGYDKAKKTAMGDALIDASAIVQDATTEAGSLKKADWGKMINKAIQTTSKRLDKPEQIREAVGLMMTKADIEKDMTAEENALNKLFKTKQIAALDKSLAGETFKEVIAKKITSASGTAPIGKELATILRITEGIDAKVIPSSELKQGQDEVEFMTGEIAKANETGTPVPPGYYVISGRVLIVDETGNIKPYL